MFRSLSFGSSSIIFLALSHAPPAFDMNTAMSCPLRIIPARNPPSANGPSRKPTTSGVPIASKPGPISSLLRGAGADVHHAAVIGRLRAGHDFRVAELLAALEHDQVRGPADGADRHALNRNGTAPPINMPMNTSGSATVSFDAPAVKSPMSSCPIFSSLPVTSTAMKLANSDTAAMTAEPMAMPFVMAFVVFPTASRSARICRAALFSAVGHEAGVAGLQVFAVGVAVERHLADAVGVVGDGAEHVHADGVAGEGEHADAAHRDAERHEQQVLRVVAHRDRAEDRRRDDEDRPHRAFEAEREAGDDVRRVAGAARLHDLLAPGCTRCSSSTRYTC